MNKAIILDFDGTLANSPPLLHKIYNKMAKEKGWPIMSRDDYFHLRRGTLRSALRWAGVHTWEIPFLLYRGRKEFLKEAKTIELFTGMDDLIHELKQAGWDIYILSINSNEAVKVVLKKHKLLSDVTVLKRASILGKHRNINRFLKKHKLKKQNVWMIGDEVRDIEAAKKSGIRSIAVTWGLQDKQILRLQKPDLLVVSPSKISQELC